MPQSFLYALATSLSCNIHAVVRFEVFTAVTMKNAVFWDKNTVHTSQETHYVSATESSQLMLCKISGFYGGDYEECRLLG
jgi:hypothetical protein